MTPQPQPGGGASDKRHDGASPVERLQPQEEDDVSPYFNTQDQAKASAAGVSRNDAVEKAREELNKLNSQKQQLVSDELKLLFLPGR